MSFAQMILPEYDQEMASTRKVLERVPEDRWDWKAHPKSNSVGWVANHLAEIPGWTAGTLVETEFDFAPVNGPRYQSPTFRTRKEVLELFDRSVADGRAALAAARDEQMGVLWSLKAGGQTLFTMPRAAVIRSFVLNHSIHHRAILTVYLRLLDVPVPGMYGPSADEQGM